MPLRGIDVSSNQPTNICSMVDYDFAIVKASGNPSGYQWNYVNPYAAQQAREAYAKTKRLGLYHFTFGQPDAHTEADFFVEQVKKLGYIGKAVLVIDYEGDLALSRGREWVRKFAQRVEALAGYKPVIYASGSVIIEQGLKALGYPLWCANYYKGWASIHGYDTSDCKIYSGCEDSALWQFTSSGYLPGYSEPLDLNICYADWNSLIGGKSTPAQPGRIEKMVQCAIDIANNNTHGYSQADRWDVDYDCSSMMYICANYAGYPIGVGRDTTRYTGTMRADFTAAGFTAIPFSQVGLGGLRRGDILLNEVHHTEMCIGSGQLVGAHSNWDGIPGDSSGREISVGAAYNYPWDYVLRPPADPTPKKELNDLKPVVNRGGKVYRLYNKKTGAHMLTLEAKERDTLKKNGWVDEGVAFTAPKGGVVPVYRLAKGNDHVFTTSYTEACTIQNKGWTYEGVPFFGKESGKAVYRLFKKTHHYTADAKENDELVKKHGWKSEGTGWYV